MSVPSQRQVSGEAILQLAGRDFILFVGRLHPIKGIDLLTRSFAHARKRGMELDLVIVGPDDGARAGVEALAQRA